MSSILSTTSQEDVVVVCNVTGEIVSCNQAFRRVTNQPPLNTHPAKIFDFLQKDSVYLFKKFFHDISQGIINEVVSVSAKLNGLDGNSIPYQCTITCTSGEHAKDTQVHCFFRCPPSVASSEEILRLNENNYRFLIESVNDIIYSSDHLGFLKYVNHQGMEFTECSEAELRNTHISHFIDAKYKSEVLKFYKRQIRDRKQSSYFEFPVVSKTGIRMWVGQRLRLLLNSTDPTKIEGFIGVLRDITEKRIMEQQLLLTNKILEKRVSWRTSELEKMNLKLRNEINLRTKTEEALKRSEADYRDLFQNAHDAIIIFDLHSQQILGVNGRACELYGYSEEEFVEKKLFHISSVEQAQAFVGSLRSKFFLNEEAVHFSKLGLKIVVDIHATNVRYKGFDAAMTINRDITKRKEMEEELSLERVRRLTALIDGQEMERRRLSSELHDGLGQLLTASLIYLKKLHSLTTEQKAKDLVLKTKEILENTVDEVRNISHNLMPSVLSDFGLETALKNMVNSVNKEHINQVKFIRRGTLGRLKADIEIGLYRIAQEALNNALKYSHANNITLSLTVNSKKELKLTVKDDGIGIDSYSEGQKEVGNGIYNMQQRASVMDCQLNIQSELRKGTTINVSYNL